MKTTRIHRSTMGLALSSRTRSTFSLRTKRSCAAPPTHVLAVCGSRLDDKIEKLIQKRKAEWGKDGELLIEQDMPEGDEKYVYDARSKLWKSR